MPTQTRVKECDSCGHVMKSVWSDGKTRIHAMECQSCGDRTDVHKNQTKYLEVRHADVFEEVDLDAIESFEAFMEEAKRIRRESTNEAFAEPISWAAVKVTSNSGGSYTVSGYEDYASGDEGVGEKGNLPYGRPDVSWSTGLVLVGDSKLEMVDVNDGSAWTYFTRVTDVEIEEPDRADIEDRVRISV